MFLTKPLLNEIFCLKLNKYYREVKQSDQHTYDWAWLE